MLEIRDLQVADASAWLHIGRGTAHDALHHFQSGIADCERAAELVEFLPGRPAVDIKISAEAQRVDRGADAPQTLF